MVVTVVVAVVTLGAAIASSICCFLRIEGITCQEKGVRKENMVSPLVAAGMRMPVGSSKYGYVKSITEYLA